MLTSTALPPDYVKNMITGAAQMDGGILVVAATDGPMPQTREHILLAKQVRASPRYSSTSATWSTTKSSSFVEMKFVNCFPNDFPGDDLPMIRGAARPALDDPTNDDNNKCIDELMAACDEYIPEPPRETDKDFFMPVEDVFSIKGRGTVVTTAEQGIVKVGDEIEIIGLGDDKKTTVTGVEMFQKILD